MSDAEDLRKEIAREQARLAAMSTSQLKGEAEKIKAEVPMWSDLNPDRAKGTVPSGVNFVFALIQSLLDERNK